MDDIYFKIKTRNHCVVHQIRTQTKFLVNYLFYFMNKVINLFLSILSFFLYYYLLWMTFTDVWTTYTDEHAQTSSHAWIFCAASLKLHYFFDKIKNFGFHLSILSLVFMLIVVSFLCPFSIFQVYIFLHIENVIE